MEEKEVLRSEVARCMHLYTPRGSIGPWLDLAHDIRIGQERTVSNTRALQIVAAVRTFSSMRLALDFADGIYADALASIERGEK